MESTTDRRHRDKDMTRILRKAFRRKPGKNGIVGPIFRALCVLGILLPLVPSVRSAERAEEGGTILGLLRSSDLAVRGKVEKVIPPGRDRICTASIQVKEILKGETQARDLWVAEELLFPSDQPSYREGRHVLLFLVDLPSYSRWKDYRARGIAHTAVGRKQGVKELDPKAAAESAAFLTTYQELASYRNKDEKKKYLGFLLLGLESRVELVQDASVEALVRLNDLRILIGKDETKTLDRFILDRTKSRTARRRLIRTLLAWEGFEESIAVVLDGEPEMRLSILQDLEASGASSRFGHGVLEACLKDPDARVRTRALALAAQASDPEVTVLLTEMATEDTSEEVRARAVAVASRQAGEEGREILLRGLEDPSPLVVYTAADEMRRIGGETSARQLGSLLQADDPKVRFIGILMLGTMEEEEARAILEDTSNRHPDEPTREWAGKILSGGGLDAKSVHKALGLDASP